MKRKERKDGKKAKILVYLDPQLAKKLKHRVVEEETTMSEFVERLLREALEEEKR